MCCATLSHLFQGIRNARDSVKCSSYAPLPRPALPRDINSDLLLLWGNSEVSLQAVPIESAQGWDSEEARPLCHPAARGIRNNYAHRRIIRHQTV